MSRQKMQRRTAMKMVALGALGPVDLLQSPPGAATNGTPAVGRQLLFFTPREYELVDQLMEMIIPADAHSPGAHAAEVSRFADRMLATGGRKAQRQWRQGVELMRQAAAHTSLASALARAAAREGHPRTPLEKFYAALKQMTVQGYYTSAIGIHKDLQYQGNTYLAAFPGCPIKSIVSAHDGGKTSRRDTGAGESRQADESQ